MFDFLFETFFMGLKNLRLHKLRSLLTALGIIFGVSAVIIMVAIGEGTKQAALEQLQQLGARNILIRSIRPPESSDASARTQRVLEYGLKKDDIERLRTVPGLAAIVILRDTEQRIVQGDIRVNANAIASTPNLFEVVNLRLARGMTFDQVQLERAERVCVLGAVAARQLFPYQDPIGQPIMVGTPGANSAMLTVIGVLEPTGLRAGADSAGIMIRDIDQDVYFPLTVSQQQFGDAVIKRQAGSFERKQIEITEVWLKAERVEDVERIASIAENLLSRTHPNLADVTVKAPIQILRNAERLNRMFNFIMVGIASFSLVVGGIGIMNIMLATVTERTREIGIRRALGAKRRHITLQFLIETTVISLSGGLIGIALGSAVAKLLPIIVARASGNEYPTNITTWSVVGSFVISGLIGIGFGLYPAVMAARMNPIEALRHE
ncbi:MAG: ABC transporter permease [Tepidisphaeraceae bacterium]